jgi:5-phospho-D-xylono-1,4-lactonase
MPEMPFFPPEYHCIETVTGPKPADAFGVTNAHEHAWIERVPGQAQGLPVLDDASLALEELKRYHAAGGSALLDCQPGGCGRNGAVLADLSIHSGVIIVGSTGFHLRKYYPPDAPFWSLTAAQARDLFVSELQIGMGETLLHAQAARPVRAGFIKVACEASLAASPLKYLEAAAQAALDTNAAVEIHTEKGADAETILDFFIRQGVAARRLVLCHMDKRVDFGLQCALAQAGVLLEYDTFFRSKYAPEQNLWPLLDAMLNVGLAGSIALASDLADAALWQASGQAGPGLAGLLNQVSPRLKALCVPSTAIQALMGGNIISRLAR